MAGILDPFQAADPQSGWIAGGPTGPLTVPPICFQLDCTGYELEELHSKVISLCSRIELVQCHSAKDRLAQSGKAGCCLWGALLLLL